MAWSGAALPEPLAPPLWRACGFPAWASSTSRTTTLRTIRLDLALDLFSCHGRRCGCRELLPRRLHLGDTGCREPFAQDRFDRTGREQAFGGGLLGEGVRNRDLDGSDEAIPSDSSPAAKDSPDTSRGNLMSPESHRARSAAE